MENLSDFQFSTTKISIFSNSRKTITNFQITKFALETPYCSNWEELGASLGSFTPIYRWGELQRRVKFFSNPRETGPCFLRQHFF